LDTAPVRPSTVMVGAGGVHRSTLLDRRRMGPRSTRLTLVLLAVLGAAATQKPAWAQDEAEFASAVKRSVSEYVIPAYRRLLATTITLTSATGDFCAEPDKRKREELVRAFADTIEAWASVDFLRFGPIARNGRYERLAFWPDPRRTGERQLRQLLANEDSGILGPGALARQSAAVQGLPALDALLFSGEDAAIDTDQADSFRCKLALAIAQNVNSIAAVVLSGWTKGDGSWAALIENPSTQNPVYRTHAEAVAELLRAILTGLEQDRDVKLLPALGDTPKEAKLRRAPFHASEQSLTYLRASAQSLRSFVMDSNVLILVRDVDARLAEQIEAEFSNLQDSLDKAGPSLEAALVSDHERQALLGAATALKNLGTLFDRAASSLGLAIVFNALDGD
jgi:predicted lipoprotein